MAAGEGLRKAFECSDVPRFGIAWSKSSQQNSLGVGIFEAVWAASQIAAITLSYGPEDIQEDTRR